MDKNRRRNADLLSYFVYIAYLPGTFADLIVEAMNHYYRNYRRNYLRNRGS